MYSFLSTVGVVIVFILVIKSIDNKYYANYYEAQVPTVESFVHKMGGRLLTYDSTIKEKLDNVIPLSGMNYQVMDTEGNVYYQYKYMHPMEDSSSVVNSINTAKLDEERVTEYIPITNEDNVLIGAVRIQYQIQSIAENIMRYVFLLVFILPFIFIVLFTYLFGGRLWSRIYTPINELLQATNQVREENLSFTLTPKQNDEIGDLTVAFETMKIALQKSLKKQWKLEQDRQEFVDAIIHDVKTPLTIMSANAEILSKKIDESNMKYTKAIRKQVARVTMLVKELVGAEDMPQELMPLKTTFIEPKHYFLQEFQEYQRFIEIKGFLFCIECIDHRESSELVAIDTQRIRQVLDNIISNGVRYTPKGGEISVLLELYSYEVSITIHDSGPGFEFKDIPHIFDKYYQNEDSKRSNNGDQDKGLGLFIVKKIVEAHGGTVEACNKKGACIAFSLPS